MASPAHIEALRRHRNQLAGEAMRAQLAYQEAERQLQEAIRDEAEVNVTVVLARRYQAEQERRRRVEALIVAGERRAREMRMQR